MQDHIPLHCLPTASQRKTILHIVKLLHGLGGLHDHLKCKSLFIDYCLYDQMSHWNLILSLCLDHSYTFRPQSGKVGVPAASLT